MKKIVEEERLKKKEEKERLKVEREKVFIQMYLLCSLRVVNSALHI